MEVKMDRVKDLQNALEKQPESWPVRMQLIEALVRIGDSDLAKYYVRESPDHIPIPPEYPARLHALFTGGIEPDSEPAIPAKAEQTAEEPEPTGNPAPMENHPAPGLVFDEEVQPPPLLKLTDREQIESAPVEVKSTERIGALGIAILAHVGLVLLLLGTSLVVVPPNPPMISFSTAKDQNAPSLDSKSLARAMDRNTPPSNSSQMIVSADRLSQMAIPDDFELSLDIPIQSVDDMGLGFGSLATSSENMALVATLPSAMRSRCSLQERINRLAQSGADTRAESAVVRGLDFLSSKQDAETGKIGRSYPIAMTGLTLLCYLGHCDTTDSPEYGDNVTKAALYLIDRAVKNNGQIATGEKGNHRAYEHAIATYALAELYTMTMEKGETIPMLKPVLRKATETIIAYQTNLGGWPYMGAKHDDMSVSGWNIQALKAAHNTGLDIDGVPEALDKAVNQYLPRIQDENGAFRYNPQHSTGRKTLTGAALLGLQIWGNMASGPYNKGFHYLQQAYTDPLPDWNLYAPYYNTQVFFFHGGESWRDYNEKFQPKLLAGQEKDGSWPGRGSHGGRDKKILNTAWAILMLEVYYRYLPTTDKVNDIKRGRQ